MKINEYMEATFDSAIPPAPRPTCGTCPHWDYESDQKIGESSIKYGKCYFLPPPVGKRVRDWELPELTSTFSCGQHPDMPAWIETEWPKVRRGR